MKIVVRILQVLLGLVFFIFGLNGFFNFIHGALPGGAAGEFLGSMIHSHYIWLVAGTQVLAGVFLLINRYVPLALVLSGALIANILMFHLTMARGDVGFAVVIALFWVILVAWYWRYVVPLFIARTTGA